MKKNKPKTVYVLPEICPICNLGGTFWYDHQTGGCNFCKNLFKLKEDEKEIRSKN